MIVACQWRSGDGARWDAEGIAETFVADFPNCPGALVRMEIKG